MANEHNRFSDRHAVVIGASMGGLITARILSQHFRQVTVIDSDRLPEQPTPRKSVPQAQHTHILMSAGFELVNRQFPGLFEEVKAAGATIEDWKRLAWFHFGSWRPRFECGVAMVHCTRYFLDWHVRDWLSRLPNVTIRDQTRATGLRHDDAQNRITGVYVEPAGEQSGEPEVIDADLVADVSGVGSRAGAWLQELGYGRPDETRIKIDLAYTSRLYEGPDPGGDEPSFLIVYPRPPQQHRAGFIYKVENNRWVVSLNGYFGDHAPTDDEGFLAFAKSLPLPVLHQRLQHMKPVTELVKYTVPANIWRHYEKMERFPDGLVVLGDAFCRFNPIFGQGMSAAASSAAVLDQVLQSHPTGDIRGLSRRHHQKQAKTLKAPWTVTSTTDLRYPQSEGTRMFGLAFLNGYLGKVLELSSTNPHVYGNFLQVLHMRTGLTPLLKPTVSLPVLGYALKSLFVPHDRRTNVGPIPSILPYGPQVVSRPTILDS